MAVCGNAVGEKIVKGRNDGKSSCETCDGSTFPTQVIGGGGAAGKNLTLKWPLHRSGAKIEPVPMNTYK